MLVTKINNFYNQNFLLDKIITKKINKEEQQLEPSQNNDIDDLNQSDSQTINFIQLANLMQTDATVENYTQETQNKNEN